MQRTAVCLLLVSLLGGGCGDDDVQANNNNGSQGVCGDGVVDLDEQCDDGAGNSDILPGACRTSCRLAHCGDGVVDAGEECDDGNLTDEDSCLGTCVANVCGDGVLNRDIVNGSPLERCDDGNTADDAICSGDCLQDMTLCGDGAVDPGEGCDDGTLNSDVAADACRTDCQPARCGDGVLDDQEECDCGLDPLGLPDAPLLCMDVNGGAGANCSASCQKLPYCGDGVDDAGEDCDEGPLNSDTAPNACRTDCTVFTCGDGVVDSNEQCDGQDLDGATCVTRGHTGGTLGCDGYCQFDESQCTG